jgi:hypothetical protein
MMDLAACPTPASHEQEITTKPRLLLDVDGVLNAWPYTRSAENPWADYRRHQVNGFTINWSPTVRDAIIALGEHVEILWLTTWEHDAQNHLAPALELPRFDLAGAHDNVPDDEDRWWKLDVARGLYEQDQRPFIWIDDDITYEYPALRWLETLPEGAALALAPRSQHGITPDHLKLIQDFLDLHNGASEAF